MCGSCAQDVSAHPFVVARVETARLAPLHDVAATSTPQAAGPTSRPTAEIVSCEPPQPTILAMPPPVLPRRFLRFGAWRAGIVCCALPQPTYRTSRRKGRFFVTPQKFGRSGMPPSRISIATPSRAVGSPHTRHSPRSSFSRAFAATICSDPVSRDARRSTWAR